MTYLLTLPNVITTAFLSGGTQRYAVLAPFLQKKKNKSAIINKSYAILKMA
jgi:hypothetical protein